LLKNMGNFKFEDVTAEAGLPTDIHGLSLAIGDVTGNGWPDIFVAGGPTRSDQHNYMFIANGDGTYRPLQDHPFDWNPYALNNEDWAGGATFGDLNRDAKLDLLVGQHFGSAENTGAPLRVYVNRGLQGKDPVFEDITARSGVPKIFSKAPHVEIQDFDNDGWPDLYTSVRIDTPAGPEPLIFTHNGDSGDPTFSSPDIVNPYYYPGGPVADFNNDGKLDVLLPRVDTRLLQNVGAPGNWLKVRVNFETGPNQYGIGAKVRVYKQGTDQLLGFREISASSGFSSSQPPEAHFGLPNEQLVDVVVSMPFGGPEYRKTSVPVNGSIVMPLGDVDTPAHLGLETIAQTGTSPQLLQGPPGLPPHTVASTAPVIDFAIFPIPDYPGVPWSQWGQGVGASNGKFYTAIGDHIKDSSGNSYLYEYDPATRVLKSVGDLTSAVGSGPGKGGHFGKVHGQINEGKDGYLYFTSYWGSQDSAAQDPGYEGSVIFRYPVQSTAAGAPGDIQPPGSVTPDNAAGESPSTVPDEVEDTPAPSDSSNEPPASSTTPPADSAVHPGNTAGESPSDVPDEIEDTPALSDSSNGPSAPSETPTADSAEPPSPAGSGGGMCSFASMKMAGLDSSWLLLGLLVPGLILARRYRLIRNFSSRKSE
jgi:hypothetical protein